MKRFIFVLILVVCHISMFCQSEKSYFKKSQIDLSILGKWPSVTGISISGDGNYAIYSINNPVTSTISFYVKSLKSDWKLDIGPGPCQFSADSKYLIFKNGTDSLTLLKLDNKTSEYCSNVSLFKSSNDGKWLAYLDGAKKLIIRSFERKIEQSVDSVVNYFFGSNDSCLIIEGDNLSGKSHLSVMNIYNKKLKRVWEAKGDEKPINYVFSQGTQLLAFMVQGDRGNSIWYCSEFNDKAIELAKQGLDSISKDLFLSGINYRGFTNNGRKIFIELKEKKKSVNPGVDIWSYNDVRLQSQQLKQLKAKTFLGVISIPDNKLIRLEEKDDKVISFGNDLAIIANIKGDLSYDEWYWNKSATSSVCLVSMNDGTKKIIADSLPAVLATSYWLSPESKYVIYYDALEKSYFSYEVSSGIKRNITKGVNTEWTKYDKRDIWMGKYMPVYCASAGWLNGDRAVLLYDQWDIYQVDPSGKTFPINLTNGYGKVNNIEFRLAFENNQTFIGNEALYLSAFNRVNKNDGFFKVRLGQSEKPQLLTSDAVVYKGTWEDERFPPVYPIKAKQVEIYVVRRMTAKDPPNYFWTTDFKSFTAITDLHPEKEFNWLTAELVNWKTPNGEQCQGILYKPEDFNPNKKYPIIFHYYERVTEAKNAFLYPAFTHGELNIPYYVSNGYLVFTPDIHYVQGHPGNSVLNTVTSAARYLSQLPYIDSKHIGLQGHSRGGWETNFIITHTNIFAAAMSASGFCDYVTLYNQIRSLSSGISRQPAYEISYQRIGATLWEKPELFIENSPIFFVNKVTTPLLMMNNKADSDVPFEQGVEFFCALRRLGKKAWMLQYDDEDHLVFDKASEDLTIRMKQFFDYYLKGEPPPEWMVNGIPAINKGTDRGFKVVPGENPRNGLVRD